MNVKYVVTGTGRCGTGFMSKLLTSAGVPCGHEAIFGPGGPQDITDPTLEADASWLAAPYLRTIRDATTIVHLTRHPQHVIDSLMRIGFWTHPGHKPYRDFARQHLPSLDLYDDPLAKSAHFYMEWNRLIARSAPDRIPVRIEDEPDKILRRLGVDSGQARLFNDAYYNSRGNLSQTWDLGQLPCGLRGKLNRMADKYGYDLKQPPVREAPPPRVWWCYLLIPSIGEHAVSSIINVATVNGQHGYTRLVLPYMRTDRARNEAVAYFRKSSHNPNDVLVFLDCDHEHPPGVVVSLTRHPPELGVVGALAYRRSAPHDPLFFNINDDENGSLASPAGFEMDRVYRCDLVGSGAIAIRRWVFDKLEAEGHGYPFFRYEYPKWSNFVQSEDVYFARCCHEAGIYHYCDTSVEIPHLIKATADSVRWEKHLQEVTDGSSK